MEAVFLKLLNMSITASWLVIAVIVLRLVLKKAPKIISLILWAFVGVRLILPFSLESIFSLVPSAETFPTEIVTSQSPTIHSGIPLFNNSINPVISQTLSPEAGASVSPMQIISFVASIVWITGVAIMLTYALISYIRIKRKVREAVKLDGNIMLCDNISSPFILGIIRPRIYVPSSVSTQDMQYVLAHENAHLKRRDHFWKPLGFVLLSVYWFNPVLWAAYILLCRDIELACDEKVITELGTEAKKPYSTALVNCSVSRKAITVCPLAFGEVGVKRRVKTVLNYKKPTFWIIIVALLACIVVAVCFLTNPPSDDTSTTDPTYSGFAWSAAYDTLYIDNINCDIDSDGLTEEVRLYAGPTGVQSYIIAVWDNKELELNGWFYPPDRKDWKFDKFADGAVYIKATDSGNSEKSTELKLFIENNTLVVSGDEIKLTGSKMTAEPIAVQTSYQFDVDGDGKAEYCTISPNGYYDGYYNSHFKFIVWQNEGDVTPKYYTIFESSNLYLIYFREIDGQVKLCALQNGTEVKERSFDISVKDDNIVLSENGKKLNMREISLHDVTELPSNTTFCFTDFVFADADSDGADEQIALGFARYATAYSHTPYIYWSLKISDISTPTYIALGSHYDMEIEKSSDGKIYIKEISEDSTSEIFAQLVYENGEYSLKKAE